VGGGVGGGGGGVGFPGHQVHGGWPLMQLDRPSLQSKSEHNLRLFHLGNKKACRGTVQRGGGGVGGVGGVGGGGVHFA
jgi:hypothetical protein